MRRGAKAAWLGAGLALLLGSAAAAGAAAQSGGARPCGCKDFDMIKSYLAGREKDVKIWEQLIREAARNPPDSPQEARRRHIALRYGNGPVKKIGGINDQGESVLDESETAQFCGVIVNGLDAHEQFHAWYQNQYSGGASQVIRMLWGFEAGHRSLLRELGVQKLQTELGAHYLEVEYLQQQLQELEKRCGGDPTVRISGSMTPEQLKDRITVAGYRLRNYVRSYGR